MPGPTHAPQTQAPATPDLAAGPEREDRQPSNAAVQDRLRFDDDGSDDVAVEGPSLEYLLEMASTGELPATALFREVRLHLRDHGLNGNERAFQAARSDYVKVFRALTARQIALLSLQLKLSLWVATELIADTRGLTLPGWAELMIGRDADACIEVIGRPRALAAVRRLKGSPLELFPPIAANPLAYKVACEQFPAFAKWVEATTSEDERDARAADVDLYEQVAGERKTRMMAGTWDSWLDGIIWNDPPTDANAKKKLDYHMELATTARDAMRLFKARFGFNLGIEGIDEDDADAKPARKWDLAGVRNVWKVCASVPGGDITALRAVVRSTDGGGSYWDKGAEITINDLASSEGAVNLQAAWDPDALRGVNVFNQTLRHEIGHHVGKRTGLDADGGWIQQYTGMSNHDDFGALYDSVLLTAFPLPSGLSPDEVKQVRSALVSCVGNFTQTAVADALESEKKFNGLYGKLMMADWGLLDWLEEVASEDGHRHESHLHGARTINGRYFHSYHAQSSGFLSFPAKLVQKRVSNYALYSIAEYFAETYAVFYSDADRVGSKPGQVLAGIDAKLAGEFQTRVDGRHGLAKETKQDTGS